MKNLKDASLDELKREIKRREKLEGFIKDNPKPIAPVQPTKYVGKDKFINIPIPNCNELEPIKVSDVIAAASKFDANECFITFKYDTNYDGIFNIVAYVSAPNPDFDEVVEAQLVQKSFDEWHEYYASLKKYNAELKLWKQKVGISKK